MKSSWFLREWRSARQTPSPPPPPLPRRPLEHLDASASALLVRVQQVAMDVRDRLSQPAHSSTTDMSMPQGVMRQGHEDRERSNTDDPKGGPHRRQCSENVSFQARTPCIIFAAAVMLLTFCAMVQAIAPGQACPVRRLQDTASPRAPAHRQGVACLSTSRGHMRTAGCVACDLFVCECRCRQMAGRRRRRPSARLCSASTRSSRTYETSSRSASTRACCLGRLPPTLTVELCLSSELVPAAGAGQHRATAAGSGLLRGY